ncbi:hypothetical protein N9M15_02545 [Bacteroidia bacterium]|nr:hypothetical protein [Bacteroidia bacterium]
MRKDLSHASEKLVSDLFLSILGQIRIFEGQNYGPGAIYGISQCLRMLHEHFEAGYTEEAKKYITDLGFHTEPRTIREIYNLSSKIEKSARKLDVEHTDGGIKNLAKDLLSLYDELKGNEQDVEMVSTFIKNNTFFITKHKDKNKDINENFTIKNK